MQTDEKYGTHIAINNLEICRLVQEILNITIKEGVNCEKTKDS